MTAVFLVANIAAAIVAMLAFVAFLNGIVGWLGDLVDAQELLGIDERLSIEYILGKLFIPLAWLMGVPTEDLEVVGTLIGLKTFINEFAAYDRLWHYDLEGAISERAK